MNESSESPSRAPAGVHFAVTGMSCNSCAARLERVLEKVPGVASASVNFALGDAAVVMPDGGGAAGGQLAAAVRDAGFDVATRPVALDIDGMTCAGCAGAVEKALMRLPQVAVARVNLAIARADVEVLDQDTDPQVLIGAVEAAGFAATVHGDEPPKAGPGGGGGGSGRRSLLMLGLATILTLPLVAQMLAKALGFGFHLSPYAELALATPVQFWIGGRFYRGAWRALKARSGNMDLLVALGTSTAYLYSLGLVLANGEAVRGHLYFEAAAVIITLVLLGKWLEERAKRSATAAIRGLMALRPETAWLEQGEGVIAVPVADVRKGDVVVVKPGERIPCDGVIIGGETEVDESLITGESMPVAKRRGDAVTGGAINGTGALRVRAGAVGADTTLARIIRLVENAQAGKAPVQRLVDRVSAVFVPAVVALAALTFSGWLLAGSGIESALVAAVSVLVIACPCALGLATPTALVAGTGAAARAGILVRDIEALERAHRVDTVIFDKTGTLTQGRPQVTEVIAADGDERTLLALTAAVQAGSEHPLARAVLAHAEALNVPVRPAADVRATPGAGVSGTVDGRSVLVGTLGFLRAHGVTGDGAPRTEAPIDAVGRTEMAIAIDGRFAGIIAAADALRSEAVSAIAHLNREGMLTVLISGDNQSIAAATAEAVGIGRAFGNVRPEGKAAEVNALQREGRTVAMVGDGLNDAPALAAADVGIAMGSGTDVAMETAGITLMRPDPRLVAAALEISRATWEKIRQNLFWAFIFNIVGLPLAASGMLSPELAGAAMALSSVSVVGNALTLKSWKPRQHGPAGRISAIATRSAAVSH